MSISNFLLANVSAPERPAPPAQGKSARGDDAFGAAMQHAIGARSDSKADRARQHDPAGQHGDRAKAAILKDSRRAMPVRQVTGRRGR